MKLPTLLLSAIILLTVSSCETITFKQPQPMGVPGLNTFPKQLRGLYQFPAMEEGVETENIKLIITEHAAIAESINSDSFAINDLNERRYRLQGENIIYIYTNGAEYTSKARFRNDSVFGTWTVYDTIVDLPEKGALKPLGKLYLLSALFDNEDSLWTVFTLQSTKGGIIAGSIKKNTELPLIRRSFTDIQEVSFGTEDTSFVLNPTKAQLQQFISKGGFSDKALFKRVK